MACKPLENRVVQSFTDKRDFVEVQESSTVLERKEKQRLDALKRIKGKP